MPQSAKAILHQALELPSNDRAALVEGLIKPNPALDAERVFADLGGKV